MNVAKDTLGRILDEVGRVVVGRRALVEGLLVALLCSSHALVNGVPGLAKTAAGTDADPNADSQLQTVPVSRPTLLHGDLLRTLVLPSPDQRVASRCGAGRCSRPCSWPTRSTGAGPGQGADQTRCSKRSRSIQSRYHGGNGFVQADRLDHPQRLRIPLCAKPRGLGRTDQQCACLQLGQSRPSRVENCLRPSQEQSRMPRLTFRSRPVHEGYCHGGK